MPIFFRRHFQDKISRLFHSIPELIFGTSFPLKRPPVEGVRGGKGAKGHGKGQTPGKGDGKGESAGRVPAELLALGCVGATPKGHRLCFDFSLKKCCAAVQNQRCSKGRYFFSSHKSMPCKVMYLAPKLTSTHSRSPSVSLQYIITGTT